MLEIRNKEKFNPTLHVKELVEKITGELTPEQLFKIAGFKVTQYSEGQDSEGEPFRLSSFEMEKGDPADYFIESTETLFELEVDGQLIPLAKFIGFDDQTVVSDASKVLGIIFEQALAGTMEIPERSVFVLNGNLAVNYGMEELMGLMSSAGIGGDDKVTYEPEGNYWSVGDQFIYGVGKDAMFMLNQTLSLLVDTISSRSTIIDFGKAGYSSFTVTAPSITELRAKISKITNTSLLLNDEEVTLDRTGPSNYVLSNEAGFVGAFSFDVEFDAHAFNITSCDLKSTNIYVQVPMVDIVSRGELETFLVTLLSFKR